MSVLENIEFDNHEQVVFCQDRSTGLKAIIAIHSTKLGPALGGCRMWNYASEAEAITDVLRLSKGMSYKAATAGLNLGGGKAVIIGDAKTIKSEKLFRSFGKFIDSLSGRYITAEDVNIRVSDMNHIAKETKHFTGGEAGSGDPSPTTALGVYHGIKASVKKVHGTSSLKDLKIAIQGCGNVGTYLAHHLREEGAKLFVADIDSEKAQQLQKECGAEILSLDTILSADVDVLAPCALGGVFHDQSIPQIKAKIIAGGANNQLLDEKKHSEMLSKAGILYAPDYVINAGGIINCYSEIEGYGETEVKAKTAEIFSTLERVFEDAEKTGSTTLAAANALAESRLNSPN